METVLTVIANLFTAVGAFLLAPHLIPVRRWRRLDAWVIRQRNQWADRHVLAKGFLVATAKDVIPHLVLLAFSFVGGVYVALPLIMGKDFPLFPAILRDLPGWAVTVALLPAQVVAGAILLLVSAVALTTAVASLFGTVVGTRHAVHLSLALALQKAFSVVARVRARTALGWAGFFLVCFAALVGALVAFGLFKYERSGR
jgi:hypothetical protein